MGLLEVDQIRRKLSSDEAVVEVDLSNYGLEKDDIDELCRVFDEYQSKSVILNLYANNLSDDSAFVLSNLFNVHEINLGHNNIGNFGAQSLIQNPNFKSIDLSSNTRIDDACVDHLSKNLNQQYLVLTNTGISVENQRKIKRALLKSDNLVDSTLTKKSVTYQYQSELKKETAENQYERYSEIILQKMASLLQEELKNVPENIREKIKINLPKMANDRLFNAGNSKILEVP